MVQPEGANVTAQTRQLAGEELPAPCVTPNRRGVFRSIADPQAAANAYVAEHNAGPKPFVWTQSAETIMAKLERCPVPTV